MKIAEDAFEKLFEFHKEEYNDDRCDLIYQECIELEEEDFMELSLIANHLKSKVDNQRIWEWFDLWRRKQLFVPNHPYLSNPYDFIKYVYDSLLKGRRYETKRSANEKFPYINDQLEKNSVFAYVIDGFVETKHMFKSLQRQIDFIDEEVVPLYKKEGGSAVLEKYSNGW